MKTLITSITIVLYCQLYAQNQIVSGEYFIDSDPGVGNAETFSVSADEYINTMIQVPLTGVESGLHVLHVRVKKNNGIWSLFARKTFYILQLQSTNNQIVAAEYFFGSDPGVGNANQLTVNPAHEFTQSFAIELNDLDKGLHKLHIRVKNTNGFWSLFAVKNIFVTKISDNDIVEIEYFVDEDPGIGNGIPITSFTQGNILNETLSLVLSDTLSLGEHMLHIRVKNEAGNWSLSVSESFEIDLEFGIHEIPIEIKLFPNPTQGLINIEGEIDGQTEFRVIDLKGKLMLNQIGMINYIDISHLPQGNYLLQITNRKGSVSKMVVKQ